MTFAPFLTPYEMLELGVFDGTYFKGDYRDFVEPVQVSETNLFLEKASQPMAVWEANGWITRQR